MEKEQYKIFFMYLVNEGIIANQFDEESFDEYIFENFKAVLPQANVSGSLLERAMLTLDDYLNAGCKKTRKQAAENAKFLYKEYYGVDYVNRNDR